MKIPNWELAIVPQKKITAYLLSPTHPDGSSKEKFFTSFGFAVEEWEKFQKVLLFHVASYEISKVEASLYGIRYIVEGRIGTPDNRNPWIRSVWFIETGESIPRFVTAYPIRVTKQ